VAGDTEIGAGAVAALLGASAAGLVVRGARASADEWEQAGGTAAQAGRLRRRLAALAEENSSAYAEALTVLDPDAPAPDDGSSRDRRIAAALGQAAAVLTAIAEAAGDVAELACEAAPDCAAALRPDTLSAALFANAAAGAAVGLIEANLLAPSAGEALERARAASARAATALERTPFPAPERGG